VCRKQRNDDVSLGQPHKMFWCPFRTAEFGRLAILIYRSMEVY
jgi:hypothetical protein